MSGAEKYDYIGTDYASVRRPDASWVARIHQALDGHRTLVIGYDNRERKGDGYAQRMKGVSHDLWSH